MDPKTDTSNGYLSRLSAWAAHPLSTDMDFVSVILTLILVITVSFLWIRVLKATVD